MYDSTTTIINPTGFEHLAEAAELAEELKFALANLGLGDAAVYPTLCDTYAAILANAAEHGCPPTVAHTLVKYHHQRRMYRFTVSDTGPGVAASLARNPALTVPADEQQALRLAVGELISGSPEPGQGNGLTAAFNTAQLPGHTMSLHSRQAILNVPEHGEPTFGSAPTYPGTIVCMTFPA